MQNDNLVRYFAGKWKIADSKFPGYWKSYPEREKKEREKQFKKLEKEFRESQEKIDLQEKSASPESFFRSMRIFLNSVFDYSEDQLDIILSKEFTASTRVFFNEARKFDGRLKPEHIYQACRNVWIMNGIQLMMNIPVELTPAIFGYSLIYPYSDNFLDDPAISSNEKISFNIRFSNRLEGKEIAPTNFTEQQIYRLVEMIESQFPRCNFPDVYRSLYSIQNAQTQSIDMLRKSTELTDDEVLEISFWKGGASVLADGFLVSGNLTFNEQRALFGYGIYLQLLDDIQDIKEDSVSGMRTIFSFLRDCTELDCLVNRSIHFGRSTLGELQCFVFPQSGHFCSLIQKSLEIMIIESVGLNRNIYTNSYYNEMEKYSPLSYSFLQKKKGQNKSLRLSLFQRYFNQSQ